MEYTQKLENRDEYYLPDAWFVLPNKILYNAGNGHEGTSLVNDFNNVIIEYFLKGKSLKGLAQHYYDIARIIKKNGFVNDVVRDYLDLGHLPIYIDESNKKSIIDYIVGVLMAKSYFYHFFEKVQNNCSDPVRELEKIKRLTNNDLVDIFVRCCGFHKVESKVKKMITTSDVNYEKEFLEYIDKGWNIKFIPPIIIRKDMGIVSVLDVESPLVKKYFR